MSSSAKGSIAWLLDTNFAGKARASGKQPAHSTRRHREEPKSRRVETPPVTRAQTPLQDQPTHAAPKVQVVASSNPIHSTTRSKSKKNKTQKKQQIKKRCQAPGCPNVVIDHGVCGRHGGGKKCYIEDCGSRVQRYGLCWKHGGYKMCSVEGCKNRAKTKDTCVEHGGGSCCMKENCRQSAITNGYCWAHGGGQRCQVQGCRRLAYKIRRNYCMHHFEQLYPEEAKEKQVNCKPLFFSF